MSVEEFLHRLDGVRRSGSGGTAKCPAHEDGHASLSVNVGEEGRILVKCHAECSAESIVAALGLTLADLMPERKKKPRRRIVATYDYRDASDSLLFQVVRFEPKDFRQRRPDGKGGWIWNLDGVQPVLYRLPELLSADSNRVVYVVEGEKDVRSIETLGLVATTSPTGAGRWRAEYGKPLQGHPVVVVPDNDPPGEVHAIDVARSISEVAASVRILHLPGLPQKGDISDWLQNGGTAEELQRLAAETPEWTPPELRSLSTLLDEVAGFIRRFVDVSPEQAWVCSLWVAHTHAIDAADVTPYVAITSPEKRSGKTRLLEVLNLLVARSWLTGRVSAAVLVRKVDAEHPTLLLDESDAAFKGEKEYAEALRGILNTGHDRNGRASLCVGQGANITYKDFSTFCPKAIAGIGSLPDTVADRAIPLRLKRKDRGESAERFRRRIVGPLAAPLRSQLESWAVSNTVVLTDARPALPDQLSDRAADGAEPLLAIADLAAGEWPDRARRAIVALCTGEDAADDSEGVRLLDDCWTVFQSRQTDRLCSEDLREALLGLEESPWGEAERGKPLSVTGLARRLKPYGVRSRTIRVGEKTAKGYLRDSLEEPWRRYRPLEPCPESSLEPASETAPPSGNGFPNVTASQINTGAGFMSFSNRHSQEPVTDEKREIVKTDAHCDGVTDEDPFLEPCAYFVGDLTDPCVRCAATYDEHTQGGNHA